MLQTKPIISIENVVASASIDEKLDLKDITKKFPDIDWNPDIFPGAVFRLKVPKTSTLLFSTGKMVYTGAKSVAMAKEAVQKIVQKLRKKKSRYKMMPKSPYKT